jgi:integrase
VGKEPGTRIRANNGAGPDHTFRAAATKFLEENRHKRSIGDDVMHLQALDRFIGDLPLRQVHMGSLQEFIAKRRKDGVKTSTINAALAVTRHVLKLAESEWIDEGGDPWLERAPKIKLLSVRDARKAYPLSREEQATFFQELPDHLARMAVFKVNTGCREWEVCNLRWDYEVKVPELGTSVFIIPGDKVKNGQDRLVIVNSVARSVIEEQRGVHPEWVFVYVPPKNSRETGPMDRMNASAWRKARARAADKWERQRGEKAPIGFRRVRVHDLKHTFGRRLRAAGVSFEDRQDLLGHWNGRITTHYSRAELSNLIAAAERVCPGNPDNLLPETILRSRAV